jgi:hypothetical protein
MDHLRLNREVPISHLLIDAIKCFPVQREVTHCGNTFVVSPFDICAKCPSCGHAIKVRSFAAVTDIE